MFLFSQLVWAALAAVGAVVSDGRPPAKSGEVRLDKQAQPHARQIADWIKQLDSAEFAERQAASKQLDAAGRVAIPALVAAAQADSAEVTTRSIAILRKQLRDADAATQAAARAGLEKIAAGSKPAAARAAKDALETSRDETPGIAPLGGIQFGGAQLELNAMFGGRRFQSVTSSMVNGERVTNVREEGRRIQITESANRGIRIEITETKDGKEHVTKYEAANADELQKKNPEIYKLYSDYTKSMFRRGGDRLGILGLPGPPIPAPPPPAMASTRELAKQVEGIEQQLRLATELIEQQSRSGDAEKLKKALQMLEESRKQLEELRTKLRGGREQ